MLCSFKILNKMFDISIKKKSYIKLIDFSMNKWNKCIVFIKNKQSLILSIQMIIHTYETHYL